MVFPLVSAPLFVPAFPLDRNNRNAYGLKIVFLSIVGSLWSASGYDQLIVPLHEQMLPENECCPEWLEKDSFREVCFR